MRRALPLAVLAVSFTLAAIPDLHAQNDRFAYAITDLTKEGVSWNALRKLDLRTGKYSEVLLNGTDQQSVVFDAVTKKQLSLPADAKFGNLLNLPFGSGVAAAAYDSKHNRLYYTPMFIDQLRYIDLKTMKVYFLTGQSFTTHGNLHNNEGKIITRMVIAPDGNGYAISNDGNTFIRFSTGKQPKIEQLGTLVDDASNNGLSIHNRCTSFGGDMICDDNGTLYIISARNNVFKINPETKVASFQGNIKGLTPNFTTNGAVVDHKGQLLVSSAVDATNYYVVDPAGWTATPFESADGIFRSSDLANSNFLSTNRNMVQEIPVMTRPEEKFSKLITVYPNPVTESRVVIQFGKVPAGDYTIELTDVLGRSIQQQRVTINAEEQSEILTLNPDHKRGVYLVKVFDLNKESVFTQKVVVQ